MNLAESVTQVAEGWPGTITAGLGIVGSLIGLVSIWLKQRGNGKIMSEVKNQVTNGHDTNLRDDVTRGNQLMELALDHVRQLPTGEDIKRIEGKLTKLGTSIDTERTARRSLESRFRERFPDETPL